MKNRLKIIGLIVFVSTMICCSDKTVLNTYCLNDIEIVLPDIYSIELLDSNSNEWILKKKDKNILILNCSNTSIYLENETKNEIGYVYLLDTIENYKRNIIYSKEKNNLFYTILIGKKIEKRQTLLSMFNQLETQETTGEVDTSNLIEKIEYQKQKSLDTLLGEKNIEIINDSVNFELRLYGISTDNRFNINLSIADIDTLNKYFERIKIKSTPHNSR